jgi:hypothetical protein
MPACWPVMRGQDVPACDGCAVPRTCVSCGERRWSVGSDTNLTPAPPLDRALVSAGGTNSARPPRFPGLVALICGCGARIVALTVRYRRRWMRRSSSRPSATPRCFRSPSRARSTRPGCPSSPSWSAMESRTRHALRWNPFGTTPAYDSSIGRRARGTGRCTGTKLSEASGRIVCYLSDDDLLLPEHVAVMSRRLA